MYNDFQCVYAGLCFLLFFRRVQIELNKFNIYADNYSTGYKNFVFKTVSITVSIELYTRRFNKKKKIEKNRINEYVNLAYTRVIKMNFQIGCILQTQRTRVRIMENNNNIIVVVIIDPVAFTRV